MLKEDGTDNSLEKSAFNLDGEFDEITRQNSILSKEEIRHLQFVEYLKKMGMREYENGTVIFYEDEYDVKKPTKDRDEEDAWMNDQDQLDYDIDLINQLFDPEPEKMIRISKDFKESNLNQSSFIDKSQLMGMNMLDNDTSQNLKDDHNDPELDLEFENQEHDIAELEDNAKAKKSKQNEKH